LRHRDQAVDLVELSDGRPSSCARPSWSGSNHKDRHALFHSGRCGPANGRDLMLESLVRGRSRPTGTGPGAAGCHYFLIQKGTLGFRGARTTNAGVLARGPRHPHRKARRPANYPYPKEQSKADFLSSGWIFQSLPRRPRARPREPLSSQSSGAGRVGKTTFTSWPYKKRVSGRGVGGRLAAAAKNLLREGRSSSRRTDAAGRS